MKAINLIFISLCIFISSSVSAELCDNHCLIKKINKLEQRVLELEGEKSIETNLQTIQRNTKQINSNSSVRTEVQAIEAKTAKVPIAEVLSLIHI